MSATKDDVKKRTRLLDHDRQKYAQEVKASMLKQSDNISSLKKENDKLKQELASTATNAFDPKLQDKVQLLQDEVDALERRIHFEKVKETDVEKRLSIARIDSMQARRVMGGVNITSDNTQLIEKQVKVLENRLDQALVKFNEALSYNKELRTQIDNLRGERQVFDEIYKKLETELHLKKKQMAEVIEKSNKDYEEREALQTQLEALKQAAKEDAKKYDEHFQSLELMMQQYKTSREQQQATLASTSKSTKSAHGRNETSSPTEQYAKKSATKQSAPEGRFDGTEEASRDEDQDLQEVVDQLKEATGIQDLDVLYHKFVKAEEHNFSMYNFVNELNSEAETLEKDITQMKDQLQSEKGDVQRRKMLKDLENELAVTEQQYEQLVKRTTDAKDSLDVLRNVTQEIFGKIGCSPEMAAEQLGTTECTESNLLQFLGIIEHRTNELMFAYNLSAANEVRKRAANRDEEAKRRRERRQQDRQARIEAGEHVPEDDDYEEDYEDATSPESAGDHSRAKFVGVGPAVAHGTVNPIMIVMSHGLPNTNAGDAGTGEAADDINEDQVYSHDELRRQMIDKLAQRRDKEEKVDKRQRRKDQPRQFGKPGQK